MYPVIHRPWLEMCDIASSSALMSNISLHHEDDLQMFPLCFVMVALWNRADHYIFMLSFLSIFFFSSPTFSGRTLDVYHTSTRGVASVRI